MTKHEKDVEEQAPEPTEATVEAGPDPIVEANEAAITALNIEPPAVEDTTYVSQEPEEEAKDL